MNASYMAVAVFLVFGVLVNTEGCSRQQIARWWWWTRVRGVGGSQAVLLNPGSLSAR